MGSLLVLPNGTQQLLGCTEAIGAIPPEIEDNLLVDLCEDHCIDGPPSAIDGPVVCRRRTF